MKSDKESGRFSKGQEASDFSLQLHVLLIIVYDTTYIVSYFEEINAIQIIKLATLAFTVSLFIFFDLKKQISDFHRQVFLSVNFTFIIIAISLGSSIEYSFSILFICERAQLGELNAKEVIQRIIFKATLIFLTALRHPTANLLVLSSSLFAKELYITSVFLKRRERQQQNHNKQEPLNNLDSNIDSTLLREAWRDRMNMLPASMLFVDKSTDQITFKNRTLIQQFRDRYGDERELEHVLLEEMKFEVVQKIQQIRSQKKLSLQGVRNNSNWISTSRYLNASIMMDVQNLYQPQSLSMVLNNFTKGMYNECLENAINSLELYCQHQWSDGKIQQFQASLVDNTKDDELIVIIHDITRQNELQQLIIKDEFKAKIIDSFSHELRTPLNSAINFLQIASQDVTVSPTMVQNFIKPAISALKLQSYLINDIIDFQQHLSQGLDIQIKEFQIEEMVQEIYELFGCQVEMKNIGFNVDLFDNTFCGFSADYKRLMQILVNLISNSIKFTQNGQIVVKFVSQNGAMRIIIQDDGVGIEDVKLRQLLEALHEFDRNNDISEIKQWQGFGLLISSILLKELAPTEDRHFKIKTNGENYSTRISFTVRNVKQNSLPMNQGIRNLRKINSNCNSILFSGNMIVLHEVKSRVLDCSSSATFSESSMQSRLSFQHSIGRKLQQLATTVPTLITDVKNAHCKTLRTEFPERHDLLPQSSLASHSSKIISRKHFSQYLERTSETQMKCILKNKKCNCRRILSVDDEIFNQKSVQCLLSRLGFDVLLAFNGDEAIRTLKQLQKCGHDCKILTLILMDYQMPVMDGIRTTITLRSMMEKDELPQVPIIGLTAFTGTADINRCFEAGMADVLAKPLVLKEFKEILELL